MDLKLETRNSILYLLPRSALILLTVLLLLSLNRANADTPHRAGVIVQHGDGSVQAQCVTFPEESITGLDILLRSGLDLNIDASNSMGATICRLDGEGCTFPQQDCFCQCTGSNCVYWSYWRWENGTWVYSNLGASSTSVTDGGIEGWVWGQGNNGASPPPSPPPIDDICAASAPTPTATLTPVPTLTGTPLPPTPLPTATNTPRPTPVGTPVIHTFTADRTDIVAGETVALRWDLSGAKAAFLRYNGTEEGVVAPGEKILSLTETTTFTLLARSAGGEVSAQLTITVRQPTATPVPSSTPISPSIAATPPPAGASNAAQPTGTPSPTATPVPPTNTPPPPTATSTATAVRPTARVAVQLAILPTATPVPAENRVLTPPTVVPTPAPRSPFSGMIWAVIALFIAVPMVLLGGAVIWWLVKKA